MTLDSHLPHQHHLPLHRGRWGRAVFGHEHINLGADAELGEVDARLHREADAGNDAAGVVCLEAVQVHRFAVHLESDAVSEAVGKPLAVAPLPDVVPCDPVGLPPLHGLTIPERFLQVFDCGVPRAEHDVEDFLMPGRHLVAGIGTPGDVGVDASGGHALGPQVR